MSLVKRENSKFWYVQFQINHRTVIRSTRTTDRKAAERIAAKLRAEAHDEIVLGRKKPITLEVALTRFLEIKSGTRNHSNLISHKRTILRLVNGSLPLSVAASSVLEEFRRKRLAEGCSPQTIKHGLNCLVGAMRLAKKNGYDVPEIEPLSVKVPNRMVRYLSSEEERRLLRELDPEREVTGLPPLGRRDADRQRWMQDNYDLVVMLIDTGARYSEIADICWKQIDLANQSINLWRSKVQNESVIFMTDRVAEIVARRAVCRHSEFVFSNKAGGPSRVLKKPLAAGFWA
jgi:integrase